MIVTTTRHLILLWQSLAYVTTIRRTKRLISTAAYHTKASIDRIDALKQLLQSGHWPKVARDHKTTLGRDRELLERAVSIPARYPRRFSLTDGKPSALRVYAFTDAKQMSVRSPTFIK
ncbi:hypothetical protein CGZ80_07135 [Rhodopirellula sp. MGV]|nr:hypothetical protein CGZ80_07135 [Rhodopirellula sp. MGV]